MRDFLYKRVVVTDDTNEWNSYKIARNRYVDKLRKNEVEYYEDLIQNSYGDNKKMWQSLKEIMGQSSKRKEINSI